MAARDYLEAFGTSLAAQGVGSRRFTPPLVTGVSSALQGFAEGSRYRRAASELKRLTAAKKEFSDRIGIDYDLFSRLPAESQTAILKSSGLIPDAASHPLDMFGGATMDQIENQGVPGRTETVPGGTGVFGGLPPAQVQVGPGLPPLAHVTGQARLDAMRSYLGGGEPAGMAPKDQSLIDYRKTRISQYERDLNDRLKTRAQQRKESGARIKALGALTANREKPNAPVDDWEIGLAKQLGLAIPEGQTVSRVQLDTWLKQNKSALAVVSAVDDLSQKAMAAEIAQGRKLTDQEITKAVQMAAATLPVLAGPQALQLTIDAVKQRLAKMRTEPALYNTPATDEETGENPDVPDEMEDTGEDSSPGYGY